MNGIEKYDLTKEEFENSLKMAELALLMRVRPSDEPKSIFIISQAGGGKTGLKTFVENENYKGQENIFVEINPDEVAIYHKYYENIMKEYPKQSHTQIQKFVRPALDDYLRKRAVQFRTNIIQEGTFGSTDGYLKILDFQKNGGKAAIGPLESNGERKEIDIDGGYNIEIDILAVDRYESLLSSYEREQYFIETGLSPRAVTAENHDRAYENLIKTVQEIENRKLYNRMRVFKRGYVKSKPELVYKSGDTKYRSTAEAVRCEREKNKMELMSNSEAYLNRIAILRKKIKSKISRDGDFPNSDVLLDKIDAIEKEFIKDIEKSKIEGRGE